MKKRRLVCLAVLVLAASCALSHQVVYAVPPLVSGDVPTAERGHAELFVGTRYKKTGTIERQLPFTELVYGISDRQEVTFEMTYLSTDGQHGFGDIVLGTKYQLMREAASAPGLAGSFEWKLKNGSQRRGLGTGAMDYDVRLRTQKTVNWLTVMGNVGYTFVGEPVVDGVRDDRRNVLLLACAQEWAVGPKAALLSEVYWRNDEEPHMPHRLAADVGFKWRLLPRLVVHAAIGKSLREANRGGPKLQMYAGLKLEF